ncbi:RsmF rRNA methyltransferase first C-terminal domain-containing protein [[Clostridium] polysaccharolyticum]|uniref:NOL1/NOP2/sun family putative RNA methylase n=1 Tax=[Clostridium] polysaccharolyticum TaxID=29364 RepID=A0A1I0AZS6_9FIRM|nr:RsmB/NOP family class I SAM-dependent RNA methyltransferase [[Clostridium] polysaccharolyticum]SES99141.1 NOL1/NOP2/sun family putative RNA methylase [[Clostridium] polysaccharolyticum]
MNLPEIYLKRMKQLLGDEFPQYKASFAETPFAGLRVNTLKTSPEEFEKLSPFALERVPWTNNGFYYNKQDSNNSKEQPGKHPYYFAGLYYIQEPSAMTPAALLPVEPGDCVLDMCAAPGGKSTELAAKLAGKGVLVTNDISASRAKALLKNVEVFGVANGAVLSEVPEHLTEYFPEYFDKILIDAPCSGEGMFRKDNAIIKSWDEERPEFFHKIQLSILDAAVKMLKPGGYMVYSTCTFAPVENEGSIQYLLDHYPEFEAVEVKDAYEGFAPGHPEWIENGSEQLKHTFRLWPQNIKGEGHFVALLHKKGEPEPVKETGKKKLPQYPKGTEEFLEQVNLDLEGKHFEEFGEKVYLVPDLLPNLRGLRILRTGLYLGEKKKNRFEPSQSLAMALKAGDYPNTINYPCDSLDLKKYLKGETVELENGKLSGWQLVLVDGYPLGWGKASNGRLKNKYLPGWRLF